MPAWKTQRGNEVELPLTGLSESDTEAHREHNERKRPKKKKRKAREREGSEPEEDMDDLDGPICQWPTLQPRHLAIGMCLVIVTVVLGMVAILLPKGGLKYHKPTWKVQSLLLDHLDLPALDLRGLSPADTADCPAGDPCGVAHAKGCSRCSRPNDMWNQGCICKVKEGNGNRPGAVVKADTSGCPRLNPCGILPRLPCSKCPDDSWINSGCICRQPVSIDQLFQGIAGFLDLLSGNVSTVMKIGLRAGVVVRNPNVVGAHAHAGSFNIRYKGALIGTARTEPRDIGANGTELMNVSVEVDSVPTPVLMQMTQEMLQPSKQLSISVEGLLVASVGFLRVKCHVLCDMRPDPSQLPAMVSSSEDDCKYSYRV